MRHCWDPLANAAHGGGMRGSYFVVRRSCDGYSLEDALMKDVHFGTTVVVDAALLRGS